MKMVDLFSLTLRVIVYIPNLHAGGEAMQVKAERKREEGDEGCSGKSCPPPKKNSKQNTVVLEMTHKIIM